MNEATFDRPPEQRLEHIVSALANGLVIADSAGRIVWMDERARRGVDGDLQLPVPPAAAEKAGINCVVSTMEVTVDGERRTLCVLRQTVEEKEPAHDFVAAIEAVLSDTSWLTRTIVEKIKAWRQSRQPATRPSDLDLLTEREREILALICEGKSDAEMSRILNLSQNTVRNHVASLYRKIGVNRRSGAIIWARERAITSFELTAARPRPRSSRNPQAR